MQVRIGKDGKIRFIYNDQLAPLLQFGNASVKRASHVEPDDNGGWQADMGPVGGPILGPFPLRSEALKSETEWLTAQGIPIPI